VRRRCRTGATPVPGWTLLGRTLSQHRTSEVNDRLTNGDGPFKPRLALKIFGHLPIQRQWQRGPTLLFSVGSGPVLPASSRS